MSKKKRVHRPPTAGRRSRSRSLAMWAVVAAVAGAAVFLVAYVTTSGGAGKERFTAQVAETPSDSAGGQPFQGGPRLYPPVESVDLGQVPLKTVVSHAFDLRNVGDATLRIEDVQVKMLEGCWPFQPVVGSTTIEPGGKSTISFDTHMMEGMGGPHLFEISVRSNDAVEPLQELYVKAVFGP